MTVDSERTLYIYADEQGEPVFAKARYPGKRFEWLQPGADGAWGPSSGGLAKLPLYRLPRVIDAVLRGDRVYIVEGEKDADRLFHEGLTATTIGSSAGRPTERHLEVLRGASAVLIIADNDKSGIKHALVWSEALEQEGVAVTVMRSPLASPKGADVSNHLDAGLGLDELVEISTTTASRPRIRTRLASDIEPLSIDWLWRNYIPAGMVTMFEGPPGVGKSTMLADLAARLTTGAIVPAGDHQFTPCNVAYLSDEDDTARIMVPRLIAAGALMTRVHLELVVDLDPEGDDEVTQRVRLDEHLRLIKELIIEEELRLLIIDPLSSYLGIHNVNSEQDMRDVLDPLGNIASDTGCAVVLVRHHKKSVTGDAKTQGGGSIGITAVARSLLMVDRDPRRPPDSGWGVLALGKSNIAPPDTPSIDFEVGATEVGDGIETSRVIWGGPTEVSADELLELRAEKSTDRGLLGETEDMILELLMEHDGSIAAKDLQSAIVDRDVVSEQTFVRARNSLKKAGRIDKRQVKADGKRRWEWFATDEHLWQEVDAPEAAEGSVAHGLASSSPLSPNDQVIPPGPKQAELPELSGASAGEMATPDTPARPDGQCTTEDQVGEFGDVLGGGTDPMEGERATRVR